MPKRRSKGGQSRSKRGRGARRSGVGAPSRVPGKSNIVARVMPDSMRVILPYSDTYTATTTYSDRVFKLNGLFDCNTSGVGAQPIGFDQWMALYAKFEVLRLTYRVDFINLASAVTTECVVYPSISSTASTSTLDIIGLPRARYAYISGTNGKPTDTLRGSVVIKQIIGREQSSLNYVGTASADPATVFHLHIVVSSVDGVTNLNCQYRVTLDYETLLFSPNQLLES